ncbi:MAG: hypothetical protein D6680_18170 [Cyanobacteria bacterium J007]|nr:MAG: hypothetical protein D6680_18170 [Cyanobacteria bacterium J007]
MRSSDLGSRDFQIRNQFELARTFPNILWGICDRPYLAMLTQSAGIGLRSPCSFCMDFDRKPIAAISVWAIVMSPNWRTDRAPLREKKCLFRLGTSRFFPS